MATQDTYALYVWGNFLREVALDRLDEWLDPTVLSGERIFTHPNLTMYEAPLRVDASQSLFETADGYAEGRNFIASGEQWRIGYLRLVSDGSLGDAMRLMKEFEDHDVELDRDPEPDRNPVPVGEIVTVWEDPYGQWDLALVKL